MRIFTAMVALWLLAGCASPEASPTTPSTPLAVAATPEPTHEPTQIRTTMATRTLAPGETPNPTPIDLAPFLTAELTVVNLDDAPLAVTVTILDPESTEEFEVTTIDIAPLQVTAQAVIPARYRLEFDYGGAAAGTCVIDVAEQEEVQFALLARGGVITAEVEPDDPAELAIATSSRCRAGGAP